MSTAYEREFTRGRTTLRFTVWTDSAGTVQGTMAMEPSEGRLYQLSMDIDPALIDGIVNMALDAADAYQDATEAQQKERDAA